MDFCELWRFFFGRKDIIITSSRRHCIWIRRNKDRRTRTLQIRVFGGAPVSWKWNFVSCYGFFQSKRHHYHLKSSSLHMNTTKQRLKGTRARNPRFGGRSCILEMEFCKLLRVFSVEKTSLLPQVVVIAYEYDKTKSVGHAGSKSGIWGALLYPGNGVLWVVTVFFSKKNIIST